MQVVRNLRGPKTPHSSWSSRLTSRRLSGSIFVPEVVSNKDLYLSTEQIISTNKPTHQGVRPNFYSRTSYDFESEHTGPDDGGMSVMDLIKHDRSFESEIAPRTESVQKLVGENFSLTVKERLVILCGLSNISISFEDQPPGLQTIYESTKLRQIGRALIKLHLSLQTVFTDEMYLSSPSDEVEHDVNFFENAEDFMIIEFMKKNLIYNNVIPFQGAMRHGAVHSLTQYNDQKTKIRDKTTVGSFYTMVGLLRVKYKEAIVEELIVKKIINGSAGLVNIRVEAETR